MTLALASAACAQDLSTGAVAGTVQDAGGFAVSHAQLHVDGAGEDGGASRRALATASDGTFLVSGLLPGTYRVTVSQDGFAPASAEIEIEIAVGRTSSLTFSLRVAPASASVTAIAVPESDPLASPFNAAILPLALDDLPIDGRRWQSFAELLPGVGTDDSAFTRLSFRGTAVTQNSLTLDGVSDTQSFLAQPRGGVRAPFRVPQLAVHEFRVHGGSFRADMGHGAGGAITTVTRSGSAQRHGTLFFQDRDSFFSAIDPTAIVTHYNNGAPFSDFAKPQDTRLQWGASASGPVPMLLRRLRRPRLFYLVAYEQQHRNFPGISSPLSTTFYSLTPTQTALLENRGLNTAQIGSALAYLDSLTGTVPREANENVLFTRIDSDSAHRNAASLTWNRARWNSPAGIRNETVVDRGAASFGTDAMHADDLILRFTRTQTPTLVNQFAVALSRDLESQRAQTPLPQEPHTGPGLAAPYVTIQDEFSYGQPTTLGRFSYPDERRLQLLDTLSWSGPASLLQAGFTASLLDERIDTAEGQNGSYLYSSETTNGRAGGLVDWITDFTFSSSAYPNGACPSIFATVHLFCFESYTQSFGTQATRFHTGEWAAFAQGNWRPARRLSIDTGVRYELTTLPPAQHPNPQLDAVFGAIARTSTLPSDTNNLAPHLGFALGLGRKQQTVMRVSYGIHFGRLPGAAVRSALANTATDDSVVNIRLTPSAVIAANCASFGSNFGFPATYACPPAGLPLRTTSAVVFSRRFQLPMVQTAQISVAREVHRFTLTAAYLGTLTHQLPTTVDLNIAPSTSNALFQIIRPDNAGTGGARNGDTFSVPVYTERVSTDFGPVTELISNANSTHHALVLEAQRSTHVGVTAQASWTWAKTLDFAQSLSATPTQNNRFDPFNPRYDYGRSSLDRRNKIVATLEWQPTTHLAGRARAITSDWTLAAIYLATSGRPYSYTITGGSFLNGGRESINGSGGLRYLPSVGRNTLSLPWTELLNTRLARTIPLRKDAVHLRVYADIFNLLNHDSTTRVQQRAFLVGTTTAGVTQLVYQDAAAIATEGLNTQPFGTRLASGTTLARQREVQFGARLSW